MERTRAPAARAHHPRDHADLRHDRARVQLDAGRGAGRRRAPAARRRGDQRAPGRVAQLPAQPRLQPVVHDRDRARLEAWPRRHARRAEASSAGAESIRKLPTLTMFKINMNLEMEGGTDAARRARRGGRAAPPRPGADRRLRRGRDPRAAGPDGGAPRRLRAGRRASSASRSSACWRTSRAWSSASCCGAWPRSCSTAGPASRPTGWACGRFPRTRSRRSGPRMAAVRGVSHCYRRPTYPDWPYSVFTMAHGRSKEECDAVLDGVAGVCGLERRRPRDALLLDRVQEGAPALLHSRLCGVGGAE